MRIIILSFLALCINFSFSYAGKEKCKLKYLEGDWYGEFSNYTGPSLLMRMSITETKGCEVKGEFLWSDYYNTKTVFSGSVDEGYLIIKEDRIEQGRYLSISTNSYRFKIQPGDTIIGTSYHDEEEIASFKIIRAAALSASQLASFERRCQANKEKYGVATIGDNADISLAEIVEKQQEFMSTIEVGFSSKYTGTISYGKVDLPMVSYFVPGGYSYMEMTFQGMKLINAQNPDYSWTFDSSDKEIIKHPVDTVLLGEASNNMGLIQNAFLDCLDNGYKAGALKDADLDGKAAYRIKLVSPDGKDVQVYYFDKDTFYLIREEKGFGLTVYLEHKVFGGVPMCTHSIDYSAIEDTRTLVLETMEKDPEVNMELFYIPEDFDGKIIEGVEELSPTNLANQEFEAGNYERAIELYSKAIEFNSYDDFLYYQRGVCRYNLGKYYPAIGDLERAIELNPDEADYLNYRGLCKYALGDYNQANEDFKYATELDSTFARAYYNRAYTQFSLRQSDSALFNLNKAIEYNPENPNYYHDRAVLMLQKNESTEAINNYMMALNLGYEDHAALKNKLGVAYFQMDAYDSAGHYFEQALQDDPKNFQYQKNLANSFFYKGEYDQGLKQFKIAQKLNAEDDELINNMGLCYYYMEDYDQAVACYNKAIEINKRNPSYYSNLAFAYSGLYKYQEAIGSLTSSLEYYAEAPGVYVERGKLYKLQNDRFAACQDFKKAADLGLDEAQQLLDQNCDF
ncbi:tetratricopeptide repeat protein [Fulvivirga maritima]|uniref:tetratricopeptide repeat protein n=1 Tax=Fulvivirga maritima TaxID=2904247 RepID=UPI001F1DB043|nr:tetratricopeptide repeat protein [Fulvivirga maritima]UII26264.1 tetratricopeptide repeat protein [Fulvivirga maritima]